MNRIHLNVVLLLILVSGCSSQTNRFSCNFDNGLINLCVFDNTPGAPPLLASNGSTSMARPTIPLSDVKSITSPTSPNGDYCDLPYRYGADTWLTHFCRFTGAPTGRACPTRSGNGTCNLGRYGLITTQTPGYFDHMYTTRNTVNGAGTPLHCLDVYYYLTDQSNNAKLSIVWTAGLGPTPIASVTAEGDKWERLRQTFPRPLSDYYLRFETVRDGGAAGFSFAIDEINVYDGPCTPLTTTTPGTTTTTPGTTTTTTSATTTATSTTTSVTSTTTTTESTSTTMSTTTGIIIISTSTTTTTETTSTTMSTTTSTSTIATSSSSTTTTTSTITARTSTTTTSTVTITSVTSTTTTSRVQTSGITITTTATTMDASTTTTSDSSISGITTSVNRTIGTSDPGTITTKPTTNNPVIVVSTSGQVMNSTGTAQNVTSAPSTSTYGFNRTTSTPSSEGDKDNLGMILGVSLGVGIPAVLLVAICCLYYVFVTKPRQRVAVQHFSVAQSMELSTRHS